jgi:hypothetical protein
MMTKITQIIEMVREDVNEEESILFSFFNKLLTVHFMGLMLIGLPFLIYVLISFEKLN